MEHRVDPEEVLTNLGFVKRFMSEGRRIPDHFLLYQSKASGITSDDYLDEYPDVRQHLEQKLAVENAFRIVNRPPPSPVPFAAENCSQGQWKEQLQDLKNFSSVGVDGQLRDKFCRVEGYSEGHLQGEGQNLRGHVDSLSAELNSHLSNEAENSVGSEVYFQGHPAGFQGRSGEVNPLSISLLTVSALFADDRLPLRYLESLMRRLRSGRDRDQAALVFDGYGLDWSWKLDSESLLSVWLPSVDLDSLSFPGDSVATDDWSMQPPTAGYWPVDPPAAADWSLRPRAARDWPMQLNTPDADYTCNSANFRGSCSMLPALQRPLSGLLSTTTRCFSEFPDQFRCLKDEHISEDFKQLGGVFYDCCCGRLAHPFLSAAKSRNEPETVDFFIDDGAEVIAGFAPQVDVPSRYRRSTVISDGLCDRELVLADRDVDVVWNDQPFTCGDLVETLV